MREQNSLLRCLTEGADEFDEDSTNVKARTRITLVMHRLGLIALSSVIAPLLVTAQSLSPKEKSLLLPHEKKVSGQVLDSSGHPIGGASLQVANSSREKLSTDSNGHFELTTRAPAVVVRKAGYKSAFVRTSDSTVVTIILDSSHTTITMCSNKSSCESIVGFWGIFCLPRLNGIKVSKQGNDVDYGQRFFSVQSKDGLRSIWHGSGPSWDWGMPSNEDVWRSVEYSEQSFQVGDYVVVDARGQTSEGKFWRYVGRWGESASYRDVDRESANQLDKVLDGICIIIQK
jgi:hypothetical protein